MPRCAGRATLGSRGKPAPTEKEKPARADTKSAPTAPIHDVTGFSPSVIATARVAGLAMTEALKLRAFGITGTSPENSAGARVPSSRPHGIRNCIPTRSVLEPCKTALLALYISCQRLAVP